MTLIAGLVLAGLLGQGLDPSWRRHTVPLAEHLQLSLGSQRDTYYRGETLRLRISATNTSDVPIKAWFGFQPRLHHTKFYYRHGGVGHFTELDLLAEMPSNRPKRIVSIFGPPPKTLNPGQHHSEEIPISFVVANGSRRFVLDQAGRYEFKVRHTSTPNDANGVLDSDILAIEVVAPPAAEREAQAAYTLELAVVAQAESDWLSLEQTRAAAAFVERFPDSRYTPPVRGGLLRSLEYRERMKRASDEERRLYQRLRAEVPHPQPPCSDSCDLANSVAGADFGRDDRELELRAERGDSAAGRTYTITYTATTAAGHRMREQETVSVPTFATPPPWSTSRGEYRRGDLVTYQGEIWRCLVPFLSSHPRMVPAGDSYVWARVPRQR